MTTTPTTTNATGATQPAINLDFGKAIAALRKGHRVARAGWNGKNMHLALQVPDQHSKMTLPYIFMFTAQADLVPWLASQTDMLATDWQDLTPDPVPDYVRQTKRWRRELDPMIDAARKGLEWKNEAMRLANEMQEASESPERCESHGKLVDAIAGGPRPVVLLTEAVMWLGMDLKAYEADHPGTCPNPYPESKNPDSAQIEPTADNLKL